MKIDGERWTARSFDDDTVIGAGDALAHRGAGASPNGSAPALDMEPARDGSRTGGD
ncbi:MAG: hypothetical protein ACLP8S_04105 [Solirubrobacteraceae bacterium]